MVSARHLIGFLICIWSDRVCKISISDYRVDLVKPQGWDIRQIDSVIDRHNAGARREAVGQSGKASVQRVSAGILDNELS